MTITERIEKLCTKFYPIFYDDCILTRRQKVFKRDERKKRMLRELDGLPERDQIDILKKLET